MASGHTATASGCRKREGRRAVRRARSAAHGRLITSVDIARPPLELDEASAGLGHTRMPGIKCPGQSSGAAHEQYMRLPPLVARAVSQRRTSHTLDQVQRRRISREDRPRHPQCFTCVGCDPLSLSALCTTESAMREREADGRVGIGKPRPMDDVIINPAPATAVPEPTTYALLVSGLIGGLSVRRRRALGQA